MESACNHAQLISKKMSLQVLPWWGFIILGSAAIALLVLLIFAIVGLSTSKYDI